GIVAQQLGELLRAVAERGVGGVIHVQQLAAFTVEDEQAVMAGVGQVEYQLQAFTVLAQALFGLFAALGLLPETPVGQLQGMGSAAVFQGQGQRGDQQQADRQAGAEHDAGQGCFQLVEQPCSRAQAQAEALVVEQTQAQLQAVPFIGVCCAVAEQAGAVLQQFEIEFFAVDLGKQLLHQRLDAKDALKKAVEEPDPILLAVKRCVEYEAAAALDQLETVGETLLAGLAGVHGQWVVGMLRKQLKVQ